MSGAVLFQFRDWAVLARCRIGHLLRVVRADRTLVFLCIALLAVDLGFTLWWGATRLLYNLEINHSLYELRALRIDAERGLPERFNYVQTLLLVVLVAHLFWIRRQWIYLALTVLFALVLADDALEIHETGGRLFARALGLQPWLGLRPVDFGETITWIAMGMLTMPLILLGLLRSERSGVADGLALLVPFCALVFFGLITDQLYHILRDAFFGADILLGMIEDGGEMVAISAACILAAAMVQDGSRPE